MPNIAYPPKALYLENIHPQACEPLRRLGFEVVMHRDAMTASELREALPGVSVLGIRSATTVSAEVIAQASDLLVVGAFGVGTNQIDLEAASRAGIGVFNAPYSNTRSVVELAVADIIALTRRLAERNADMHAGRWYKSASGSHEVRGRTLGIVGYGNIGSQLSVLAENLGMRVVFYDVEDKLALGNAYQCETLEELLERSDVVTLHVDGRRSNEKMFADKQFAAMKPQSLFLNLSRGFIVDDVALQRAIESGHIAGAALDVFPNEPKAKGDEFISPLRDLPNVILTPHIGAATEEAQCNIGRFVGHKLAEYLSAGATSGSVNFPQLALPELAGAHRIVHIHRNQPGVLAAINNVLAGNGVNIDAQYLGTRGDIGYVITDIAADLADHARSDLENLPATMRVRVLS